MEEKLLEKLMSYVQSTENFLKAETPEYIKQLLEYAIFDNMFTLYLLGGILGLFALMLILSFVLYVFEKGEQLAEILSFIGGIGFSITLLVMLIEGPSSYKEIVKIQTAPKVYIIDYLTK